ncbi:MULTISPECIES: super-infection exclusion protein B [unclassified Arsenophonus]|uniref:super-infection exclusion protein B n=1 Tax=unclassified Arsenophonus TaxID=2627083 RepID=UPI0028573BD1|nr:super-infection exclusion protein B [Arsenophonus sp.]MDR5611356.1 super-infection exclusion protein B [Arsenophonus sp.]MDR5615390.1 super-infection exclusion protein B [Arsenophonus sp.]
MELLAIIGRVINSEPLERVMWFVIIWVSLLMLSPESWGQSVNAKIGIPHVWHVFVFALSFVLALNTQRVVKLFRMELALIIDNRKLANHKNKIAFQIANLSYEEKTYLAMFVDTRKKFLGGNRGDLIINSLIEKNIIYDVTKHLSTRYSDYFTINPEYFHECAKQLTCFFDEKKK